MKLLTNEIKEAMPRPGATEAVPVEEKLAICKFFYPMGAATWFACEGEQQGDDYEFFGLVCLTGRLDDAEWGTFTLTELESIGKTRALGIERDIHFPIGTRRIVDEMRKYAR